jgi:hypothetical protein
VPCDRIGSAIARLVQTTFVGLVTPAKSLVDDPSRLSHTGPSKALVASTFVPLEKRSSSFNTEFGANTQDDSFLASDTTYHGYAPYPLVAVGTYSVFE